MRNQRQHNEGSEENMHSRNQTKIDVPSSSKLIVNR